MQFCHEDENGDGGCWRWWMLAVVALDLQENLRQQRRTGLYFERGPTSAVLCFGQQRHSSYQCPSRSTTKIVKLIVLMFFSSNLHSCHPLLRFISALAASSFQPPCHPSPVLASRVPQIGQQLPSSSSPATELLNRSETYLKFTRHKYYKTLQPP